MLNECQNITIGSDFTKGRELFVFSVFGFVCFCVVKTFSSWFSYRLFLDFIRSCTQNALNHFLSLPRYKRTFSNSNTLQQSQENFGFPTKEKRKTKKKRRKFFLTCENNTKISLNFSLTKKAKRQKNNSTQQNNEMNEQTEQNVILLMRLHVCFVSRMLLCVPAVY